MIKNTAYLLFLFTSIVFSQKKFNKEFSIKSDNDLYTSKSKDRYYTSGLFLTYRYDSKKNSIKLLREIIKYN